MGLSETTKKWQKLSKRLTIIAFAFAVVVCIITFVVLGVSLNNESIGLTVAVVVACVIVVAAVSALFITYFLINRATLKHLEEARASEEEANKAKRELLTDMSRDVRTPLNTIMGMTTIGTANVNDSKQVANCFKKISLSSRQLLGIINKVLDTSEVENVNIVLPEVKKPVVHDRAVKEEASIEIDLNGKRILVAEDNDLNWEIANLLLTREGFEVERAENGQTCVDMLLGHKPGYYDAILMDVRMPVMSGLEATTVIRRLNKKVYNKIPIIAMTADAFPEDKEKCLECGMNAHIAKPMDIDVVKATLANFIIED